MSNRRQFLGPELVDLNVSKITTERNLFENVRATRAYFRNYTNNSSRFFVRSRKIVYRLSYRLINTPLHF